MCITTVTSTLWRLPQHVCVQKSQAIALPPQTPSHAINIFHFDFVRRYTVHQQNETAPKRSSERREEGKKNKQKWLISVPFINNEKINYKFWHFQTKSEREKKTHHTVELDGSGWSRETEHTIRIARKVNVWPKADGVFDRGRLNRPQPEKRERGREMILLCW